MFAFLLFHVSNTLQQVLTEMQDLVHEACEHDLLYAQPEYCDDLPFVAEQLQAMQDLAVDFADDFVRKQELVESTLSFHDEGSWVQTDEGGSTGASDSTSWAAAAAQWIEENEAGWLNAYIRGPKSCTHLCLGSWHILAERGHTAVVTDN